MLEMVEFLNARILVAEDLKEKVALHEKMLCDAGYRHVTSTRDSRSICSLHAANRFDLILLDLEMSGLHAHKVMEALNEIEPLNYLPLLVITGESESELSALQAGARDFVSRPFDPVELLTRIRNMLEVRLLYQKISHCNDVFEERVQTHTAELRKNEARLKSFIDLSSDWYWEQDASGKITTVSGPALEMLGLDNGFITQDALHDAGRATLVEKIVARLPFLDLVYDHITAQGVMRTMRVSGEPVFDSSSRFTGYRGIGTDITTASCTISTPFMPMPDHEKATIHKRNGPAASIDVGNALF